MNHASLNDTIVAIATPIGRGGIGIIRLSGVETVPISQCLMQGVFPKPRVASYRNFLDSSGTVIDQGICIYFPKPHSFTGEDVVEFQGHGSPAVLNMLLTNAIAQGARLARPGEFSERAFFNHRLDLAQAEAIADLIHAGSEQAARAAMRSLEGVFSKKVNAIDEALIKVRVLIEATIDFSEEAIESLAIQRVTDSLKQIIDDIKTLQNEAKQGQCLQEGMQLVIAGPPNAGKSSLLNALSGQERAIVSETAGTTRDIVRADIIIDGLPIHILDTAGLRVTANAIEQEGMQRALAALEKADQILWVVDSTQTDSQMLPHQALRVFCPSKINARIATVRNKIDLNHESCGINLGSDDDTIHLSVKTGQGIDILRGYLKERAGYNSEAIGFSARERHIIALARVEACLMEGLATFNDTEDLEIIAIHLKEAHQALGEITGLFTTEDLLGHIFSTFCIGK